MTDAPAPALTAWPVPGVPEVRAGDDLAGLIAAALDAAGLRPLDGDVLVVASKVVSKALGLTRSDATRDALVAEQSLRVVAARRIPTGTGAVVQSTAGPVMAAAGVDASNSPDGTVLLLPADPDAEARSLRSRLAPAYGVTRLGLLVADTAGRAWREGQTDLALGAAGLQVVEDLRGSVDAGGRPLDVTVRALADEVAAAADLVRGKAEGVPLVLVRGLTRWVTEEDGPGAASLLRGSAADWFRLGHVEAVRAALGVPVALDAAGAAGGAVGVRAVWPEPVRDRLARAVAVALHGCPDVGVDVGDDEVAVDGEVAGVARAVARLEVAAWAEDLHVEVVEGGGTSATRLRVSDAG